MTFWACCGARSYLEVLSDDVAMWGLHGGKIEQYVSEIETLAKANATLTQFHERRRSDIESGELPSVAESLSPPARLASSKADTRGHPRYEGCPDQPV